MNTNASPATALFVGQKIDGGAVHVFQSFRRGVATYCTGRSISLVVGTDAAAVLGCTFVELSHYETDREKPSPEFISNAARYYRADVVELALLLASWDRSTPARSEHWPLLRP